MSRAVTVEVTVLGLNSELEPTAVRLGTVPAAVAVALLVVVGAHDDAEVVQARQEDAGSFAVLRSPRLVSGWGILAPLRDETFDLYEYVFNLTPDVFAENGGTLPSRTKLITPREHGVWVVRRLDHPSEIQAHLRALADEAMLPRDCGYRLIPMGGTVTLVLMWRKPQ